MIKAIARRALQDLLSKKEPRFTLEEGITVSSFLEALEERSVKYVILRWFEDLPNVEIGEDLDILIEDSHIEKLKGLVGLNDPNGRILCDIYSTVGSPGYDFRSVAYYPSDLSAQILSRSIKHQSGAWVPCLQDHFLSLAYHAVYHKGYNSGLPESGPQTQVSKVSDHDYYYQLCSLRQAGKIDICEVSLRGLHQYLRTEGYSPPVDTLLKLGAGNAFCTELANEELSSFTHIQGLAAFIVRSRADKRIDEIVNIIRADGFDVYGILPVQLSGSETAHRNIRGGNWRNGPHPTSGGGPSHLIVAVDVYPLPVPDAYAASYPLLDNMRILTTKIRIRNWFNSNQLQEKYCNVIHSSDNSKQAQHYIGIIAPEKTGDIVTWAQLKLKNSQRDKYRIKKSLTRHGKRAKVELIERNAGEFLVLKTFRKSCQRFFEREVGALEQLRKIDKHDVIPPIIFKDTDKLTVAIPYYENFFTLSENNCRSGSFLSLGASQVAFLALKNFYEHGFEFADFAPHNLLLNESDKMKFIDFEFVFKTDRNFDIPFISSMSIKGPDPSVLSDVPLGSFEDWYKQNWYPVTAISLDDIFSNGVIRKTLKRASNMLGMKVHIVFLRLKYTKARIIRLAKRVLRLAW